MARRLQIGTGEENNHVHHAKHARTNPGELEQAKDRVRQIAYLKWQEAGRPFDSSQKFWLEAEPYWIEYEYTPHRDDMVLHR
jgi:hypothetical protein